MTTVAIRLLRAAVPADDPWDNPPTWSLWRELLPHVLAATDAHHTPDPTGDDVSWLLNYAGMYVLTRGEPPSARPLLERALSLRRSMLGEDHPDTLDSASNLAINLHELGQYEQARHLNDDTLTRRRRVLGDEHLNTLNSAWLADHSQVRKLVDSVSDTLAELERAGQHPGPIAALRRVLAHHQPTAAGRCRTSRRWKWRRRRFPCIVWHQSRGELLGLFTHDGGSST